MAGAESKGARRYDKENLLWQSTVAIKSDPVGSLPTLSMAERFAIISNVAERACLTATERAILQSLANDRED